MTETNFKIIVEYDGRAFAGWQRQAPEAGPTVQGTLEQALSRLCAHPVTLHGSGRTDAGVHARAQCANFRTASGRSPGQIIRGGNCLLPPEVAILAAEEAAPDFHARFSAAGKVYAYEFSVSPVRRPLLHGRAWWVGAGLDLAAMERALPCLLGEHDFAAFQSAGSDIRDTTRAIFRAELSKPGPETARLTLEGSGFLRHMVRTIAGTLAAIGRGALKAGDMAGLIASRDRRRAGPTAPPGGLYLDRVLY
ncbi:MAG: tRNA pseudouridine(38-40) synthase TruA [Candidatus Adiutrix sp.]|nr:tRNA pseudouridine(38-40) synthase TruA [Candidatus Adiutrix sp.]